MENDVTPYLGWWCESGANHFGFCMLLRLLGSALIDLKSKIISPR